MAYTGLDAVRREVSLAAGQRANHDFDLTTAIYTLEQFKVVGEREGDASAITAQRNAENLKHIAATDSFGNLSNMNAGEVAIRLPGIAPNLRGRRRNRRIYHSRNGAGTECRHDGRWHGHQPGYTGSQNQNTVPNATTTSIVPGFTNRITVVRPVPTSRNQSCRHLRRSPDSGG